MNRFRLRPSIIYHAVFFIAILAVVGLVLYVGLYADVRRHHQHLHRPSEAELEPCDAPCYGLCTHLPIITIDTFGEIIPGRPLAFDRRADIIRREFITTYYGETEILAHVTVVDNYGYWSHPTDAPAFESMAMIRLRGNSSRWFDKPNYRIGLVDEHGEGNPLPLLGMNPHAEWALHGPFLDKTLMRNYMWMNIGAEVMGPGHFVPELRFFELILNGEYQGLYVLMETVRVGNTRLGLNRYREGMFSTSFLARFDSYTHTPERKVDIFATHTLRLEGNNSLEVMYPRLSSQSYTNRSYVAGVVSAVERHLYSAEVLWYPTRYERYLDRNSFVNFFLLNEFLANNDLWTGSTYIHKDVRGRVVAGPIWDFNNVMDNFFFSMPYNSFMLVDRGWFNRLMMCDSFTDAVVRRWNELRHGVLAEERLVSYMDEVVAWLGSAVERNFEVWGYSFDPRNVRHTARRLVSPEQAAQGLTMFDVNPGSFDEAMEQKKDFMVRRGRWMDDYIETVRQYSHPSRHALWILR